MSQPRVFPSWEELYRDNSVENLPWYWPTLDPDLEAALARHGMRPGRILDQGTGPGTQAIALAERGFTVTAADVSGAALAYVARKAKARGVDVTLVKDDVLVSRLAGPFDAVFDRGCFHVIAPERRAVHVATMHRLIAPAGLLFLKTFSHHQPGERGPYRFTQDELRAVVCSEGRFEALEILETVYQGQLDPYPKALFAVMRRSPA
jgi:cyclopropane fatty-acyl-phospholipid synthase-like methyltransferase